VCFRKTGSTAGVSFSSRSSCTFDAIGLSLLE
jgi:hypothetical protein